MSDKNKVKDDGIYMVYENSNVLRGNSLLLDSRVIDFDVAQKCLYSAREEGRLICNDEVLKEYILPNRIFFHQELMTIFEAYGFEIVDLYGDYNLEKFDKGSRKQIFTLRRK